MNGLSPWALSASSELAETNMALYYQIAGSFKFKVYQITDSIWVRAELPNGGRAEFRAAFSPGGNMEVKRTTKPTMVSYWNWIVKLENSWSKLQLTSSKPLRYCIIPPA